MAGASRLNSRFDLTTMLTEMKPSLRSWISLALLMSLAVAVAVAASASPQNAHSIRIEHGQFILNGKPFQVISGEMHYARIPRAYWRDRLQKARAMGLNAISTYVFWDLHEPKPGSYDFRGQLDIAEFVREAQQEGLYVILRPGPYVCSEWDLGGLPSWLLADPRIRLRSNQEDFLRPAAKWLKRLGLELAPLQITRGGPIIAVQIENEYGSFGDNRAYMSQIRDMDIKAGFDGALLYTADGPSELPSGTLPSLPAAVNFGPGDANSAFAALRKARPAGPFMSGEYWDGWFDHWGEAHNLTDAKQQAEELDWMLSRGYSVNLYMFEGGTSFGFMAGANYGKSYQPDTTSYDYDAPLDEAGRPTSKYFLLRDVIARDLHKRDLPRLPRAIPRIQIPPFKLRDSASLWNSLGQPIRSVQPETMEAVGQAYGYILYRTHLNGPAKGVLTISGVHDYAFIFINASPAGTIERRLHQDRVPIELRNGSSTLDILVENLGRINFGPRISDDRKGITGTVTFEGHELTSWEIYPLPMKEPESLHFTKSAAPAPAFYRGTFTLARTGDTFLDVSNLGMGVVWLNGHNLGRFWNIGPQQTLYVPGVWLRRGLNQVIVFDTQSDSDVSLSGRREPILDHLRTPAQ